MPTLRYRSVALLVCALAAMACEKNAVQDITGTLPGSTVKFFHFGVNAPQVNFYANDTKVTAISSTTGAESTTGTAYGAAGLGGLYSAIEPGQYTFTGRIAAATDKDLPIATITATLEDGKQYSVYMSGFYNTTSKTVDGFIVADDYNTDVDYSVATVRFVNAISNANAMTMYATNTTSSTESAVGGAVAYKSAGAYVTLEPGIYNLATRYTGSSSNAIARTSVAFSGGRVYTITARGDITVTSTTATNRPFLDNTANR